MEYVGAKILCPVLMRANSLFAITFKGDCPWETVPRVVDVPSHILRPNQCRLSDLLADKISYCHKAPLQGQVLWTLLVHSGTTSMATSLFSPMPLGGAVCLLYLGSANVGWLLAPNLISEKVTSKGHAFLSCQAIYQSLRSTRSTSLT